VAVGGSTIRWAVLGLVAGGLAAVPDVAPPSIGASGSADGPVTVRGVVQSGDTDGARPLGGVRVSLMKPPLQPAVDEQVVEDVELGVEGVLLRADAQPAADGRTFLRRVAAEDAARRR
jgi:hypothetical protein